MVSDRGGRAILSENIIEEKPPNLRSRAFVYDRSPAFHSNRESKKATHF